MKRAGALSLRLVRQIGRRLSWGVADQAVSSLTNFAVSIYIARYAGRGAVRRVQPGLRDLRVRAQRVARPGHRPAAGQVQRHGRRRPGGGPSPSCTGTAAVVGLVTGACVLVAAALLSGAARLAFLALGLTLPGLLLQDSWRYSFFALGRGSQAFLNDTIWAVALIPALVLAAGDRHANVFWFVFAWGAAAAVGGRRRAAAGPGHAQAVRRWRVAVSGTATSGPATSPRAPPTARPPSCATTASASSWAWPPSATCRRPPR